MAWNYQTEVTADTPYLWYRLNETSGTTATDSGSGAQNGTYAGTAAEYLQNQEPIVWNQGRAVRFNEDVGAVDDGRVTLAGVTSLPSTDIACEMWIENPSSLVGGVFLCNYTITGPVKEFVVEASSAGGFNLYIKGTIAAHALNSPNNTMQDGRLHHLYFDWRNSDGRSRMYFDGVQHSEVTGTQTAATLTSGGTLMLAQDQTVPGTIGLAADAYEGRMDQFAIYSAPLSDARIQTHASAGIVRNVSLVDTFSAGAPLPTVFEIGGVSVTQLTYVNRAFDNIAGTNVIWKTADNPDIATGTSYPGPGVFDPAEAGQDTESHAILAILVS